MWDIPISLAMACSVYLAYTSTELFVILSELWLSSVTVHSCTYGKLIQCQSRDLFKLFNVTQPYLTQVQNVALLTLYHVAIMLLQATNTKQLVNKVRCSANVLFVDFDLSCSTSPWPLCSYAQDTVFSCNVSY